jgi:hypothetical protein
MNDNKLTETVKDNNRPKDDSTNSRLPDIEPSNSGDEFDNLDKLRLSQNFSEMTDVKAVITVVAVHKPHRHEFVRVRPGAEWHFETGCFTDKESRETYLIIPSLWSVLPGEVQPTVLYLAMSRNSPVPFLWPCSLPSSDGRPNRWHESAIEAARLAETQWLRVMSDMSAGCYVPYIAQGSLPEPEWPELSFQELMRLAFRDRFIRDTEHAVLRRLRGDV